MILKNTYGMAVIWFLLKSPMIYGSNTDFVIHGIFNKQVEKRKEREWRGTEKIWEVIL